MFASSGARIVSLSTEQSMVEGTPWRAAPSLATPLVHGTRVWAPAGGAQEAATEKVGITANCGFCGGKGAGHPPFLRQYQIAPNEANGTAVTSGIPIRTTFAPVARSESTSESYCTMNFAAGFTSAGSPGLVLLIRAPRTSLEPAHTVTNVGFSCIISSTSVRPPSMMVLSGSNCDGEPLKLFNNEITSLPGTARLFSSSNRIGLRAQVLGVPPPTRVRVTLLVSGGGHPGMLSEG